MTPRPVSFDGRSVLAVTAHPDDEVLAFGGTLSRSAAAGSRVSLLCLTRGELGWAGSSIRPGELPARAALRERELEAAAAVLGVGAVRLLEFPDGRLRDLPRAHVVKAVQEEIERLTPEIVLTFGEDGLYWHLDHTTVYYATVEAVVNLGGAPDVHHAIVPAGAMRAVWDAACGGHERDGAVSGISPDAFGLHARVPTECVDVADFVDRKLAALRCHRSQFPPDHPLVRLELAPARQLLGVEYFHPMLAQVR